MSKNRAPKKSPAREFARRGGPGGKPKPAVPMSRLSRLLAQAGLRLKKSLGQNFLVNQNVLEKIAAAVGAGKDSLVVEIGCGMGNLTQLLAGRAGKVLAVELDERFRPIHEEHLASLPNVRFLYVDFMDLDLSALARENGPCSEIRVVGNIPYHLTSPILFKLMASSVPFRCICLLLQYEVAQRLAAQAGSRLFGILAAKGQSRFDVETVFAVSPGSFLPPPKVRSALARLTPRAEGDLAADPGLRRDFFSFIDAAFSQRRKFAAKSLAAASRGVLDRSLIEDALADLAIDRTVRAEQLPTEQLFALFEGLGRPQIQTFRKTYEE